MSLRLPSLYIQAKVGMKFKFSKDYPGDEPEILGRDPDESKDQRLLFYGISQALVKLENFPRRFGMGTQPSAIYVPNSGKLVFESTTIPTRDLPPGVIGEIVSLETSSTPGEPVSDQAR